VLASLERSVPQDVRPSVAAALCELKVDCEAHTRFIIDTLTAASRDESRVRLAEAAAHALAVLGAQDSRRRSRPCSMREKRPRSRFDRPSRSLPVTSPYGSPT
jgi:hypothetical protein